MEVPTTVEILAAADDLAITEVLAILVPLTSLLWSLASLVKSTTLDVLDTLIPLMLAILVFGPLGWLCHAGL